MFFFNDTASTEYYPLSLHDALPICGASCPIIARRALKSTALASGMSFPCLISVTGATISYVIMARASRWSEVDILRRGSADRKSTRLNSSHLVNSYAVFCLKQTLQF